MAGCLQLGSDLYGRLRSEGDFQILLRDFEGTSVVGQFEILCAVKESPLGLYVFYNRQLALGELFARANLPSEHDRSIVRWVGSLMCKHVPKNPERIWDAAINRGIKIFSAALALEIMPTSEHVVTAQTLIDPIDERLRRVWGNSSWRSGLPFGSTIVG